MLTARLFALVGLLLALQISPTGLAAQPPLLTACAAGTERLDEHGIAQAWLPPGTFIAGSTQEQVDAAYQTCLDIWPGMCLEQEYTAELSQHLVTLTAGFWIDQYEVTNAAYQEFVADGGYSNREYWSDDGWRWKGDQTGSHAVEGKRGSD